MTSPPELSGDLCHVHLFNPAPSNQGDPVFHKNEDEQGIQVFHVYELVGENGNVSDITIHGGLGNDDINSMDSVARGRLDQVVQQKNLFGCEFPCDDVGENIEIGSMADEESRRPEVFLFLRKKREVSGIFLEAP